MLTIQDSIESEEVKVHFRMIFNRNVEDYRFPGIEYIKLLNEYGKMTGDLDRSKHLIDLHFNIQEEFSKSGVYLDDYRIVEFIRSIIVMR